MTEQERQAQLTISDTMLNLHTHLANHNNIVVGVSGGSDSNVIVHLIATNFRQYLPKIHFVFENTGIEYRATLKHLDYMEKHYNIHIDRIRPEKGNEVVPVVRREGVPIISKDFSKMIYGVQHNQPWAFKRINRTSKESHYGLSKKQKALADYLVENEIKVSSKCCDLSKKKPHLKYLKSQKADLTISGERKCEGGARASAHKGCYGKWHGIDKYMPLWWWDDFTKKYYKDSEGIVYSDCYEVWGMERTGCVGCPYNSKAEDDLKMIKKYEPTTYKVCMNVFGESYRLMDEFNVHRHKILAED